MRGWYQIYLFIFNLELFSLSRDIPEWQGPFFVLPFVPSLFLQKSEFHKSLFSHNATMS